MARSAAVSRESQCQHTRRRRVCFLRAPVSSFRSSQTVRYRDLDFDQRSVTATLLLRQNVRDRLTRPVIADRSASAVQIIVRRGQTSSKGRRRHGELLSRAARAHREVPGARTSSVLQRFPSVSLSQVRTRDWLIVISHPTTSVVRHR